MNTDPNGTTPLASGQRDWPEDFSHENGNYNCRCSTCGQLFTGHKRRVTCKLCSSAIGQPAQGLEEIARQFWAGPRRSEDLIAALRAVEAQGRAALAELAAWKESQLAVESEWDAQKIATLLGATLGQSCRKVIMQRVPEVLAERDAATARAERLATELRKAKDIFDDIPALMLPHADDCTSLQCTCWQGKRILWLRAATKGQQ